MTTIQPQSSISLTTDIVSAYVSNNSVPEARLKDLILTVYDTVQKAGNGTATVPTEEKATPSQIKKSITHDALISFIDGKPYKTLKRHLTLKGYTPEQYRTKFGLPKDYPMISASYSQQRSELAKLLGLGQRGRAASRAEAKIEEIAGEALATATTAESSAARRGGRRKAEAQPSEQQAAPASETKTARARRAPAKEVATETSTERKPSARKAKAAAPQEAAPKPESAAKGRRSGKAAAKTKGKGERTKSAARGRKNAEGAAAHSA